MRRQGAEPLVVVAKPLQRRWNEGAASSRAKARPTAQAGGALQATALVPVVAPHGTDKVWLTDRVSGATEPVAKEIYYMGLGFPRWTFRIAVVEMERQYCVRWSRRLRVSVRWIEFDRLESISKLAFQCFKSH